ncbi:nucleotidyltransferase domain-containing protein [Anaerolineales bacterium HSG24]|nr:nucleotidyltransferase domain-containing protein [Anaerolineales bacterium HSG24]
MSWTESDYQQAKTYFYQREQIRQAKLEQTRLHWFNRVRDLVQKIAPQYPAIKRVYLFGSLAQLGRFRSHSDIDLAVVCTNIAAETVFWRKLEQVIKHSVDVRPLTESIAEAVKQYGILLYERQDTIIDK